MRNCSESEAMVVKTDHERMHYILKNKFGFSPSNFTKVQKLIGNKKQKMFDS